MPTLVIQGQIIDFPDDSASPDWAQGVIEFAEATTAALAGAVGTYDVSPQTFDISAYPNQSIPVNIPNLSFSNTVVLAANIQIACTRTSSSGNAYEYDELDIIYNSANSIGMKWEMTRTSTGNGNITYTIADSGQVEFTTTTIGGTSHVGTLSYSAKALLLAI